MNFSIKTTLKEIKPGCWNYTLVEIFQDETKVGEYTRNYPGYSKSTFFPFKLGEGWFALYSRDYTATRLMKLPSCEDVGGEEPKGIGFCPMEFYVPEITGEILKQDDPAPKLANYDAEKWVNKVGRNYYWPDDEKGHTHLKEEYLKEKEKSHKLLDEWRKRNPIITQYAPWGFVGGCVWGDDSSMKLQFLDLSKANEGILIRDDRFGYIALPSGVNLKDAIDTGGIDYLNVPLEQQVIKIAMPVSFSLDGKRVDND